MVPDFKNLSIDAKELDEEETKQDEDWGNPPSPDTPANHQKSDESSNNSWNHRFHRNSNPGILYWIKFK